MGWFSGNYQVKDKLVVISGGSQGLGAALAKECVSRGANVIIVARTEAKLKRVVEACETVRVNDSQKIDYVTADLSSQSECARVFEQIGDSPDIVMCVAGLAIPGFLLDTPPEVFENSIDSIYKSSLYFSVEGLRAMSKKPVNPGDDKRHITLFSSVVAFYAFIGYGSYAPLKMAIRGLYDILRQECFLYDVEVECVFPGTIATEGLIEEEKTKPEITRDIEGASDVIQPDDCSKLVLGRLDAGSKMVHTDTVGWILNSIMLGASPRTNAFLLSLVGFVLLIFSPLWALIIDRRVKSHFKEHKSKVQKKIRKNAEPTKS